MFQQTFKNIDDVLWKEAGCTTELDYTEQSSWILFLKYLDDLEHKREGDAALAGRAYSPIIEKPYRWQDWAAPKKLDGTFDHDNALTGDDLIAFVNGKLFPYLHKFKERAASAAQRAGLGLLWATALGVPNIPAASNLFHNLALFRARECLVQIPI